MLVTSEIIEWYCGKVVDKYSNGAALLAECKAAKHGGLAPKNPYIRYFHDPEIGSWVVEFDFNDGWLGRAVYPNTYLPWTNQGLYAGVPNLTIEGKWTESAPIAEFGISYEEFGPADPKQDYFWKPCQPPTIAAKDQNGAWRCFKPCPPGFEPTYKWPETPGEKCKCEIGLEVYEPGSSVPTGCEVPPPGTKTGIICKPPGIPLFDPVGKRTRCYPPCPAGQIRTPAWPPEPSGCDCPEGQVAEREPWSGEIIKCRNPKDSWRRRSRAVPSKKSWIPWFR